MHAPRLSSWFFVCLWAASCGGNDFSASPGAALTDASAGGTDAGASGAGGTGGSAGKDGGGGDSATGGTAGGSPTGGAGGSSGGGGNGGTAGAAGGTAGTAGAAGTAGSAGAAGTAGAGGTAGNAGSSGGGGSAGVAGSAGASGAAGAGTCPTGQTCFQNLPYGWTPVATGTTSPIGCSGVVHELYSSTDLSTANSHVCPCECAPPTGASCALNLGYYTDAACSTASSFSCKVTSPCVTCTINPNNATHLKVTAAMTGTCAASSPPSPPEVPSSGFECLAYASDPPAACQNNGKCIKTFGAPSKICIMHTGKQTCPYGYSAGVPFYFETITDSRTCDGTCTCEKKCSCTGQTCGAKIFPDLSCQNTATSLTEGTCTERPGGTGVEIGAVWTAPPQPACVPNQIKPLEGQVGGTNQVTICCKQ